MGAKISYFFVFDHSRILAGTAGVLGHWVSRFPNRALEVR
jgi:hypothetical protein